VLGDHQFLEGYCLLLADPVVDDLGALDDEGRRRFLLDMSLVGEAVMACTDAWRVNYEILGNADPVLHAHVWPRFSTEAPEYRSGPVHRYPPELRRSVPYSPIVHGAVRDRLRAFLRHRLGVSTTQRRDEIAVAHPPPARPGGSSPE